MTHILTTATVKSWYFVHLLVTFQSLWPRAFGTWVYTFLCESVWTYCCFAFNSLTPFCVAHSVIKGARSSGGLVSWAGTWWRSYWNEATLFLCLTSVRTMSCPVSPSTRETSATNRWDGCKRWQRITETKRSTTLDLRDEWIRWRCCAADAFSCYGQFNPRVDYSEVTKMWLNTANT